MGLGTPREIHGGVVDGNYFEVMGLRPVLGRLLTPSDDGPNAAGAIVLTNRFWSTSLHSDPGVLGKTVRLDSFGGPRSAVIVGVLEPSVPYPVETEIIANVVTSPHHLSATMVTGREHRMTEVFARLAPDAELDPARAELRHGIRGHTVGTSGDIQARRPLQNRRNAHARSDQFTGKYDLVGAVRGLWSAVRDCVLECCQSCAGENGSSRTGTGRAFGVGERSTAALRRSLLAESPEFSMRKRSAGVASHRRALWWPCSIAMRHASRC